MTSGDAIAIGALTTALHNTKALVDAALITPEMLERIINDIMTPFDRPEMAGDPAGAYISAKIAVLFPGWIDRARQPR